MHREFQFGPELPQELNVASPLVPEDEIRPDTKALNVIQIASQPPHEGFAGLLAKRLVELDEQQGVGAQ